MKIAVSFAALAVELGGEPIRPFADPARHAIFAIRAAFEAATRPAGMDLDRSVALRVFGERREADCHQHEFALPRRRQTAFHASGPITLTTTGGITWNLTIKSRWRCTAGR